MKHILEYLFICALLASSFWLGRQSVQPIIETVETVRIDTIFKDRLVSISSTIRPVSVSVPHLVFVRVDTCTSKHSEPDTMIPSMVDSVTMIVDIETRTYRDSLLTAQVSGPVIGNYHPTLDWYEVYRHTRTITNTVTKRNRFAVTAGAGVAWTPKGIQPAAGVQIGVILWSF